MNMKESLVLHSYTVTFAASFKENGDRYPDLKGPKLKQIMRIMLGSPDFESRKISIVTDFQLNLISLEPLPEDIRNQKVDYFHEAEGAARGNAQTYNLHIVPVSEFPFLRISDLLGFLTSTARTAQYPEKASMVQALNILIGHYTVSDPTTIMIGGKRGFPQSAKFEPLRGGLIAVRGFFSSVRLASHRTLVNVNISHGAFYEAIDLQELMNHLGLSYVPLETFVKGLKFKTKYLKDKFRNQITRIKTISSFAHPNDGYGQEPPPIVDHSAGSPFQVFFHPKDSDEFAKLTSGKYQKHGVQSAGYEQRKWLKEHAEIFDRGPGIISVAEFFGESAFCPCIYSLKLLTPHRIRCLDRRTREIPCGQCRIEKGPKIHTC